MKAPEFGTLKKDRVFEIQPERKNRKLGQCATRACWKRPFRTEKFCYKCKTRRWKERNPVRYAWNKLRSNARRRGIAFLLPLIHWKQFCEKNNLLAQRGRSANALSVDRIDGSGPYAYHNIRPLSVSENSRKQ